MKLAIIKKIQQKLLKILENSKCWSLQEYNGIEYCLYDNQTIINGDDEERIDNTIYFFIVNESISFPSLYLDKRINSISRIIIVDWPGLGLMKNNNGCITPKDKAVLFKSIVDDKCNNKNVKKVFLCYKDGYEILSHCLRDDDFKNKIGSNGEIRLVDKVPENIKNKEKYCKFTKGIYALLKIIAFLNAIYQGNFNIFKYSKKNLRMLNLIKYDFNQNSTEEKRLKFFVYDKLIDIGYIEKKDNLFFEFNEMSNDCMDFIKNNGLVLISTSFVIYGALCSLFKIIPDIVDLNFFGLPLYELNADTKLTSIYMALILFMIFIMTYFLYIIFKHNMTYSPLLKNIRRFINIVIILLLIILLLVKVVWYKFLVIFILICWALSYCTAYIFFNDYPNSIIKNIEFCICLLNFMLTFLLLISTYYFIIAPYDVTLIEALNISTKQTFILSLALLIDIWLLTFTLTFIVKQYFIEPKELNIGNKTFIIILVISTIFASIGLSISINSIQFSSNKEIDLVYSEKLNINYPKLEDEKKGKQGVYYMLLYRKQDTVLIAPVIYKNDNIYIFEKLYKEIQSKDAHYHKLKYKDMYRLGECDWDYMYSANIKEDLDKLMNIDVENKSRCCVKKE